MKQFDSSDRVINHYEPASVSRTVFGVLASLFSMGLPIGLAETLRAGGDGKVAVIAFICAALAAVFAFLSIRGTMTE